MAKVECVQCYAVTGVEDELLDEVDNNQRKRKRASSVSDWSDVTCVGCGVDLSIDTVNVVDDDTPVGAPAPVKAVKAVKVSISGRSSAAPPILDWPVKNPPTNTTYFQSIFSPAWANLSSASYAKLVFEQLDPKRSDSQGLAIELPRNVLGKLRKHFESLTDEMKRNEKITTCCEAVGEAAAALKMMSDYPDFQMELGFTPGPGIDQIWCKRQNSALTEILIVEAKGPDAGLSDNVAIPPGFRQMNDNWIVDNLVRMSNPLGKEIIDCLGYRVGASYPNWGGASKTYYGVISQSAAK